MRLSEAIREGASLRPQAIGVLISRKYTDVGQATFSTCAIAAAFEAVGGDIEDLLAPSYQGVQVISPCDKAVAYLKEQGLLGKDPMVAYTLEGTDERHPLSDTIMYLNDDDEWSRERIADWLESIGY